MRIGSSLLLLAVGAILRFAVTVSSSAVNLHTVGIILMVVGGIGLLFSLLWLAIDRERDEPVVRRRTYVDREVPVESVRTVRDR